MVNSCLLLLIEERLRLYTLAEATAIMPVYLLAILAVAILFFLSSQSFVSYWSSFFNLTASYDIEVGVVNRYLMTLLSLVGFAGFFVFYLAFFSPPLFSFHYGGMDYGLLLRCVGGVFGVFLLSQLLKLLFLPIVRYIFSINRDRLSFFLNIENSLFSFLGIMLLVLSFIGLYSPRPIQIGVLGVAGVLFLLFCIKVVVAYFNCFQWQNGGWYRFFLYLCTLKFLPILIVVKMLVFLVV